MKTKAITLRILGILVCAALAIWMICQVPRMHDHGAKLGIFHAVLLSIPIVIAWGLIESVWKACKPKPPEPKRLPRPTLSTSARPPLPDYIQGLAQAAHILSNNHPDTDAALQEATSVQGEYAPLMDYDDHLMAFLDALGKLGFIGSNDWKFTLEDFVYNSLPAFAHYGLDASVYDKAKPKPSFAPEAFQILQQRLPESFGVGIVDADSDTYYVAIAPRDTLFAAQRALQALGERLYVIEPGKLEDI